VVDELAGLVARGIGALLHAIFQTIVEALFRVLFEIVFVTILRILSAIYHSIVYVARLMLWKADRIYRAFVERLRRGARRPVLAHGLALVLLSFGGFVCGASASTLYHNVHPIHHSGSTSDTQ